MLKQRLTVDTYASKCTKINFIIPLVFVRVSKTSLLKFSTSLLGEVTRLSTLEDNGLTSSKFPTQYFLKCPPYFYWSEIKLHEEILQSLDSHKLITVVHVTITPKVIGYTIPRDFMSPDYFITVSFRYIFYLYLPLIVWRLASVISFTFLKKIIMAQIGYLLFYFFSFLLFLWFK